MMTTCCGIVWAIVVGALLSGQLRFSQDGDKDWEILDDKYVEDKDAIRLATQEADCLEAPNCPPILERSMRNYERLGMELMFRTLDPGAPIFTSARLQRICQVERIFFRVSTYPRFCKLNDAALKEVAASGSRYFDDVSHCEPEGRSVTRHFYLAAGMDPLACEPLPEELVNGTGAALHAALADPAEVATAGLFLGADVYDGAGHSGGSTTRTKSQLGLGYPLEAADEVTTLRPVQKRLTREFYEELERGLLAHFGLDHAVMRSAYWDKWTSGDIEVLLWAKALYDLETLRTIDTDLLIAIGSIIFVGLFLAYRTGSAFVATVTLWGIVMSTVLGFAVYRLVLQIGFFHNGHAMIIFIILGIGADDIFVFSDAWYRSESEVESAKPTPSENRGEEQGVSTKETAGDILAARIAVAYKHAMMVVLNTSLTTGVAFLATATSPIMPIKSLGIYACLLVLINYVLTITLTPITFAVWHTYVKGLRWPRCCIERARRGDLPMRRRCAAEAGFDVLGRCFIPVFKHRPPALAVSLLLLAWGAANAFFAAQLSAPTEDFQWFTEEHMFVRSVKYSRFEFATAADAAYNTLSVTFGIQGVNRCVEPGVDMWEPHLWYGIPVYDSGFNLSTKEAQDFLRQFCQSLRDAECTAGGCQPIGYLVHQSEDAVSCFIEDFDAWANGTEYEGEEFLERLAAFRREEKPRGSGFVESSSWEPAIGFVDGVLRYVRVRGKMSLIARQGEDVKEPVLERLEDFLAGQQSKAPRSMRSTLQTVPRDWTWTTTVNSLAEGLFTGFAICFPAAFVLLLLTTQNLIVALLAMLTVALVVACVLGYCQLAGWTLGPAESIAGVIVIGLSVDYTIHMGHMYLQASRLGMRKRAERWEYAVRTMGATVLAGAATTFVAGLMMQVCQIRFFNIMSVLMVLTISYSLLYTLCFFMAVMRIIGPEDEQGEVSTLWAMCCPRCRPRTPTPQSAS